MSTTSPTMDDFEYNWPDHTSISRLGVRALIAALSYDSRLIKALQERKLDSVALAGKYMAKFSAPAFKAAKITERDSKKKTRSLIDDYDLYDCKIMNPISESLYKRLVKLCPAGREIPNLFYSENQYEVKSGFTDYGDMDMHYFTYRYECSKPKEELVARNDFTAVLLQSGLYAEIAGIVYDYWYIEPLEVPTKIFILEFSRYTCGTSGGTYEEASDPPQFVGEKEMSAMDIVRLYGLQILIEIGHKEGFDNVIKYLLR